MPSVAQLLIVVLALGVWGCSGLSDREAEDLVRRYNGRLIEAYRMGDFEIMEGLVGDSEAAKLLGLIGAKLDMGITLDSELLELTFLRVERAEGSVEVLTEERWHYRDRRIGTGTVVGPESTDHYLMRYVLRKPAGSWVIERVRFEVEPQVGRVEAPGAPRGDGIHDVLVGTDTGGAATEPDTTGGGV